MNLILQHWHGPIPEVVWHSFDNISAYAERIGAEHIILRGKPFDKRLTAPCQKLHMLSGVWDEWEQVCMVDADMFARPDCPNIFEEDAFGIYHPSAHRRVVRNLPELSSMDSPFWGGAIYRFPRAHRSFLRHDYDYEWAKQFNSRGNGEDEGILHCLAMKSGWSHEYEEVYFGQGWAWASYADDFAGAKMVHCRHHDGKGNRVDKMDVYRELKAKGIL